MFDRKKLILLNTGMGWSGGIHFIVLSKTSSPMDNIFSRSNICVAICLTLGISLTLLLYFTYASKLV